jgi:ribulose-5-phosphate 4-epimerase/fuculose-1-phosphate aldolase
MIFNVGFTVIHFAFHCSYTDVELVMYTFSIINKTWYVSRNLDQNMNHILAE